MGLKVNIEDQIIAYFEGEISEQSQADLLARVGQSKESQVIFKEYEALYKGFSESNTIEVPSEALKAGFDSMISKEQLDTKEANKSNSPRNTGKFLMIGFGILVLSIASYWYSTNSVQLESTPMIAMTNEIDNLLKNASTSQRIKGVLISNDTGCTDLKVLNLLVNAAKNDPSPNVRIAALESLESHLGNDKIRSELYKSLALEKDPVVLITYINLLTNSNPKSASDQLQKITEDEGMHQFIKDEAYMGLFRLQEY